LKSFSISKKGSLGDRVYLEISQKWRLGLALENSLTDNYANSGHYYEKTPRKKDYLIWAFALFE